LERQQRKLDSVNQVQIAEYKRAFENATTGAKRTELLEARTKSLEDYNQRREAFYLQQVSSRFNASRDALKDMTNGVVIIGFMQEILNLEQDFDRTTNLWADSSFRNFWDDLQRIGSAAGLIIAGCALIANNNQTSGVLTAGVSIAGLSSILGIVFGEDKSDKLREKAEFIDLTRRAYDDLNIRYFLVQKYVTTNDSLEARLNDFKKVFSKPKNTLNDSLQAIAQVKLFYQEYELVLKQIPNLLAEFESMQKQYVMRNAKMNSIFTDILKKVTKVKNNYNNKVLPILDLSADIKKILGS